MTELIESNGVLVVPGQVKANPLVVDSSKKYSSNSHYDGTWGEVEAMVSENIDNWTPGTGSKDGDVRLVHLPPEGFFTTIARITDDNRHLVESEMKARRPGEYPVETRYIRGEKEPAAQVKAVIYRADVLAQDSDRTSDAEWEIVAILADPAYDVPMHPHTMERNFLRHPGGTYREYTEKEWRTARKFWDEHVYIRELDPRTVVLEYLQRIKSEPLEDKAYPEVYALQKAFRKIMGPIADRFIELREV